jgi:cell division protein FtsB
MRTIIIVLIGALFGIQYKLWLGDGGIFQTKGLEKRIAEQTKENQRIATRNKGIEADIAELKSGEQALEEQARYELGMVKEGETYYQVLE